MVHLPVRLSACRSVRLIAYVCSRAPDRPRLPLASRPCVCGFLGRLSAGCIFSVKIMPKEALLQWLPQTCDIVCTHPMFGPESGKQGWRNLPFVYEAVRVADRHRLCRFLSLWEEQVSSARAPRASGRIAIMQSKRDARAC
jgi:hypothetical protein